MNRLLPGKLGWLLLLLLAPAAWAQQRGQPREPHIGYIYPAGGQVGTTFQVAIGGQYLEGVTNAFVSGPGVRASISHYRAPLNQRALNIYRDKLQALRKQLQDQRQKEGPGAGGGLARLRELAHEEGITDEILMQLAEMRQQRSDPKRQLNPQLAEVVLVTISLAADAPIGDRELRLLTANGLSNPLTFQVGHLKEVTEERPRISAGFGMFRREDDSTKADAILQATLPAVINGQILPGDTDKVRFQAQKGDHLVMAVAARSLIPYLADAVPGWFQATLTLFGPDGREVAYADDFRFNPDPVIYYQVPASGQYTLEIKDAIYRGREDFVYRILVGELPFITSVDPLGASTNSVTTVALRGWNLPTASLSLDCRGRPTGVNPITVRGGQPVPFAIDTWPEQREQEPNNTIDQAQGVSLPRILNGCIERPGDWDLYWFEGKAGQEIVAEVVARRLNSPLDSQLKLLDSHGKSIGFNDDAEDKAAGLTTHHADSRLQTRLPADGVYYLQIGDTQQAGSPSHAYRLRLGPPQPDFALRVTPASLNGRPGGTVKLTVFALRQDGFTNAIALALKNPPTGFRLNGSNIPSGKDSVELTLTVPRTSSTQPIKLEMEGRAVVNGQELVRTAVPAEDMMQAFAYRHLVPAQELLASVTPRPPPQANVLLLSKTPLQIPPGGTARLKLGIPKQALNNQFELELQDTPGVKIQTVKLDAETSEIIFAADPQARPGQKGNLAIKAFVRRAPPPGPGEDKPAAPARRVPFGALPDIPYEISAATR